MRSPRPAWMIIARQRSGIASASACTWATVSGTIRAVSDLGRLSRATGLDAIRRSWTAALNTGAQSLHQSRTVAGDKTLARSATPSLISEARTAESLLSPMVVPSMCLLIKDSTLSRGGLAVRSGRCPFASVFAHCDRVRVVDVRA